MNIAEINDFIHFDSKESLVKALLYLKLTERGIRISDNDLNVLTLYTHMDEKDTVIQEALDKKYVKSWQSGENSTTLLVNLKLLDKPDKKIRKVNPEIFPSISSEFILATCKLHNLKQDAAL